MRRILHSSLALVAIAVLAAGNAPGQQPGYSWSNSPVYDPALRPVDYQRTSAVQPVLDVPAAAPVTQFPQNVQPPVPPGGPLAQEASHVIKLNRGLDAGSQHVLMYSAAGGDCGDAACCDAGCCEQDIC